MNRCRLQGKSTGDAAEVEVVRSLVWIGESANVETGSLDLGVVDTACLHAWADPMIVVRDWLAIHASSRLVERAPGWCRGPSYEIPSHDEHLENHELGIGLPCYLGREAAGDQAAYSVFEGSNKTKICVLGL